MQQLKILNKKEIKHISGIIKKQWNTDFDFEEYAVLKNNKDKLYLFNKGLGKIDLTKLRINSIGMYFGEMVSGLRLSIEGSQIVGSFAKKNVVNIDDNEAKKWLRGEDVDKEGDFSGFVIIQYKDDFLGSGKYINGKILNYVPKNRRIKV